MGWPLAPRGNDPSRTDRFAFMNKSLGPPGLKTLLKVQQYPSHFGARQDTTIKRRWRMLQEKTATTKARWRLKRMERNKGQFPPAGVVSPTKYSAVSLIARCQMSVLAWLYHPPTRKSAPWGLIQLSNPMGQKQSEHANPLWPQRSPATACSFSRSAAPVESIQECLKSIQFTSPLLSRLRRSVFYDSKISP